MKQEYLEKLKKILDGLDMSKSEREDIISDYASMYEDGLEKGMDDQSIIEMLGTPEAVVDALSEEYHPIQKKHYGGKLIALMPFISVIAFFILGFGFEKWHPGWLVFLSIPVTAIVVDAFNKPYKHFLTALSPFIATVIFLAIGFGLNKWHPTWLIFFIVPIIAIINGIRESVKIHGKKNIWGELTGLVVFLALTVFILIGTYFTLWNPGWLVLLLIPIAGMMNEPNIKKRIVLIASILVAAGFYLFVGYQLHNWLFGLLGFLLPLGVGILTNNIQISFGKGGLAVKLTVLLALLVYFGCGLLWSTWGYLWMVFLSVPMVAIITEKKGKNKLVALSPFIAVIIFFSLGFFFDLWTVSWLAFLMIPILGILSDRH